MWFKELCKEIKESISGIEKDYTQGSIKRAIFLLAIPMILEMIMESVFAIVDIYFVGSLGAEAISVVGITESLLTMVYAIGIGLGMGTTAIIARRTGEKNQAEANTTAFHAIIVTIAFSIPISIVGIFYSHEIFSLMGATGRTLELGEQYAKLMLGSNIVIMLLFVINAIFRSSGDAAISMRVLILSNLTNIILDPIFIFGIGSFEGYGVMGAAIATVISRLLAVVYQFYLLFNGHKRVRLIIHKIKLSVGLFTEIVTLSIGGIAQYMIATASWIILVRLIASFGDSVTAGYTIALRIIMFALLPAWGLSNAVSTLVGQNLGAKQPDRAEKSTYITWVANCIFVILIGGVLVLFAESFIGIFSQDPEVIKAGAICLKIIAYGFPFYATGMVLAQAFNGAGDTYTPTIINFIGYWVVQIPLAYILMKQTQLGFVGVLWAIPLAEMLLAIIALWWFKKGKWKNKMV